MANMTHFAIMIACSMDSDLFGGYCYPRLKQPAELLRSFIYFVNLKFIAKYVRSLLEVIIKPYVLHVVKMTSSDRETIKPFLRLCMGGGIRTKMASIRLCLCLPC